MSKKQSCSETETMLWEAALRDGGIVDTHLHLDQEPFETDREAVLERARRAGVKQMISIGCGVASSQAALRLAEQHEDIFVAVGIHPHDAGAASEADFLALQEIAKHPKVVAIGEIGLDYFYMHAPKETQQQVFQRGLELAALSDLPFVIHSRDAEEDTIALLEASAQKHRLQGVIHCFSGTLSFAERCLSLGLYLSIPGMITFVSSVKKVVRELPLERLLIETDAPYLAPAPFRGQRNEPAYVRQTALALAELLRVPPHLVASTTTHNAQQLFRLPPFVEADVSSL
ncbi:TatD family hydrolase [Myxococcota bacterium]|nr:TatD family hydrolase [Myxococcota bacterium]